MLPIVEAKKFFLEKGQLAESIYDLFINKCHFIGLFTFMTLNFKYVVYESCQFDDRTVKNFRVKFFAKNIEVLANFLSIKIYVDIFLLDIPT